MNDTEKMAQFGHHPDPAIDFCVEVEALLGELENHHIGFTNGTPPLAELNARIERAMAFRVGGDANAVLAKQQLLQAHDTARAQPASVSDGWVLVPRKPTGDMILAGIAENNRDAGPHVFSRIYAAMLAAAPKSTASLGDRA